jgi:hypothetical protein
MELLAQTVLDAEGNARVLGELIDGAPAVMVFVRHFG